MMKIKLGIFLLSSLANAQTITQLQTEITQKHGIEVIKPLYSEPGDSYYINDSAFRFFLEAFFGRSGKTGIK